MAAKGVVGFALLTAAGLWLGWQERKKVYTRVSALRGFSAGCLRMKHEVSHARRPPADMMRVLQSEQGPAGRFFEAVSLRLHSGALFGAVWDAAVEKDGAHTCLRPEELVELQQVGRALAAYNQESAAESLDASAEAFRLWAENAEATSKNDARLKQTLFLTAALLIGIFLL